MKTVVTEVNQNNVHIQEEIRPTMDEMLKEYRFFLAMRMIQMLYCNKAISKTEFRQLQRKFQRKYRPHLVSLMD